MSQSYKVKLSHILDDGDKIEFEAFLKATSHDAAFAEGQKRFAAVVAQLAAAKSISIDKSKVEFGAMPH